MPRVEIHPYHSSRQKRWFDVVFSSLLLVTMTPLLLAIGLVILLTAGRPVLYSQKRTGLHGKVFALWKFRTMKVAAERLQKKLLALNEAPYPMFKLHNDPRFVGVGRWLSNTGIDELPQLWNILIGDMSFVGPRPLPINESKELLQLKPQWQFRLKIKPGIFSEWSIDERRHQSLAHWQKLDLLTVTSGGLGHELKIITATAANILLWTIKTSISRFLKLLRGELSSQTS